MNLDIVSALSTQDLEGFLGSASYSFTPLLPGLPSTSFSILWFCPVPHYLAPV